MLQMMSIASGSSGNCIYIGTDNTHILIDAGISAKRIQEGLHTIGLDAGDLDGIFITHEHSDHIAGLNVLAKDVPEFRCILQRGRLQDSRRTLCQTDSG